MTTRGCNVLWVKTHAPVDLETEALPMRSVIIMLDAEEAEAKLMVEALVRSST
jgi:hypothetical protein